MAKKKHIPSRETFLDIWQMHYEKGFLKSFEDFSGDFYRAALMNDNQARKALKIALELREEGKITEHRLKVIKEQTREYIIT